MLTDVRSTAGESLARIVASQERCASRRLQSRKLLLFRNGPALPYLLKIVVRHPIVASSVHPDAPEVFRGRTQSGRSEQHDRAGRR